MASSSRVTLIFDTYGVYEGQGQRVRGLQAERRAFAAIDRSVKALPGDETISPITLVMDESSACHFATFRRVAGVKIIDLTPRNRVAEILRREPPPWLSNELIRDWGLLGRQVPQLGDAASWENVVAEWLIPGISAADTLQHWLRALCSAPSVDGILSVEALHLWFINGFSQLLQASHGNDRARLDLVDEFQQSDTPTGFARQWATRRALLPLVGR